MATLRELKGRIGSVGSSEKITGAMKMISSAKMRKAEAATRRLRPFRDQVQTVISNLLSADAQFSSPLMAERPVRHAAIVVLGSDDGLCGAYNVNIFKHMLARISELRAAHGDSLAVTVMPVGAKMLKAVRRVSADWNIAVRVTEGIDSKSGADAVNQFAASLRDSFIGGEFDMVDLLYMHFVSMSRQQLAVDTYLPVSVGAMPQAAGANVNEPYIFEPDPNTIFNAALPLYLMSLLQEVFCENRTSEQAARIMAMQSANDNAKKLLEQLQLEYNKLRQQSITNELLDILGGQIK